MFVERGNREEKSQADWTNRHILGEMYREEKENKLSVFNLLTHSV